LALWIDETSLHLDSPLHASSVLDFIVRCLIFKNAHAETYCLSGNYWAAFTTRRKPNEPLYRAFLDGRTSESRDRIALFESGRMRFSFSTFVAAISTTKRALIEATKRDTLLFASLRGTEDTFCVRCGC